MMNADKRRGAKGFALSLLMGICAVCFCGLALTACAVSPLIPDGGTNGGNGNGGGSETPSTCEIIFLGGIYEYRTESYPLFAECSCGDPLEFAVTDGAEALHLSEDGKSFATELPGTAEIAAFHKKAVKSQVFEIVKGKLALSHADVTMKYGERLADFLDPGFSAETPDAELAIGENTVKLQFRSEYYEDGEVVIKVRLDRADPVSPPAHRELSDEYFEGITLGAFSEELAEGFSWKKAETVPEMGRHFYPAIYCPDDRFYEPFETELSAEILRGKLTAPAPGLSAVTYDEMLTLSRIPLPEGFSWKDENVCPQVSQSSYPAVYDPDPVHYEPAELEISLEVIPKRSPNVDFPAGPFRSAFDTQTAGKLFLTEEQILAGFYFENDEILHADEHAYSLELCYRYRNNPNYSGISRTVSVKIDRAQRLPPRYRPTLRRSDSVIVVVPKEEPFSDELEFSANGTVWTKNRNFSLATVRIAYRYGETRDYCASEPLWTAELPAL